MKKGIFTRIFLIYGIIIVLSALFIEIYIASVIRNSHISDLKKSLAAQINLVAHSMPFGKGNLDGFCRQMREKTGARVTIIAADGSVMGDSDKDSSLMGNHSTRPEIEHALRSGIGSSIRHSETLNYDFLYIAKKVTGGKSPERIIRMAIPLKEIDKAIVLLRIKIIIVITAVLLLSGIVFMWHTDYLRRLLKQVTWFSQSLARGGIEKRLFMDDAEFNEIARNLNAMAENLQEVITKNIEEKERLSVILKSIPDVLIIVDSRGVIQMTNPASAELFRDETILGKQLIEVVRNQELSNLVHKVLSSRAPGMVECRFDYPQERYMVIRVSPLLYRADEPSGFVAIFHDITKLKKLEQMRKDFVANVSHEIKTPITAIAGFAETLLDGALADKEHAIKFLSAIKSNSMRINSLVNDLMTLSKIELGAIKIEKALLSVEDVIEDVLAVLGNKAAEKNLSIATSVVDELRELYADKNRLTQILVNLTDNAIKFTEKGSVTIGTARSNGKAVLFVEDTGIGIPEDHLSRLGERFYRVDTARSRKMGGTGLGLAIVKHLVSAHGWNMRIESTPGKGTKVELVIA